MPCSHDYVSSRDYLPHRPIPVESGQLLGDTRTFTTIKKCRGTYDLIYCFIV